MKKTMINSLIGIAAGFFFFMAIGTAGGLPFVAGFSACVAYFLIVGE